MQILQDKNVEFLVGGAYALAHYTGIARDTKDFDLFLRPADVPTALAIWRKTGYEVDFPFTHWLAKVRRGKVSVDVIFSSGNGLCRVDDSWFEAAPDAQIFGVPVKLVRPEEMIWQKAYIMERERFDGADVAHLVAACAPTLDWTRLVQRFDTDWRVLWSHLVLFGFIFPSRRHLIPLDLVKDFDARIACEQTDPSLGDKVCNGTLLSRIQYESDLTDLSDAREQLRVRMTREEIQHWIKIGFNLAQDHQP
jgi:predicted nucleotidyltransferase